MKINLEAIWIEKMETGEEIEKYFHQLPGWFKGPGWYLNDEDHMLIVSIYDNEYPFASDTRGPWRVFNYGSDIGLVLGAVSNAPTRQDARGEGTRNISFG